MAKHVFLILLLFYGLNISFLKAEEIVTTKENEPDAFYGLKIGGIFTPTYGYRVRSPSGISNTDPNEKTGFSSPWTLLMISKDWEENGIKAEFWTELLRNSSLTSDTKVNGGSKSNPYTIGIRRANVQKSFKKSNITYRFIFGIHELPHVYSQWKNYWDWRYLSKGPMESFAFAAAPADLGLSFITEYKWINFQISAVNGEGYQQIQNTDSAGFDLIGRLSFEPTWKDTIRSGLHFVGRKGNVVGVAGNECREGETSCVADDGKTTTYLLGDLRTRKSRVLGAEWDFIYKEYVNFGVGFVHKKGYGGRLIDMLDPVDSLSFQKDSFGRGRYVWIGLGYQKWRFIYRRDTGTGQTGSVESVETNEQEIWNRIQKTTTNGTAVATFSTPKYSSKESFLKNYFFLEYLYNTKIRFALGMIDSYSFEKDGTRKKTYINLFGLEKTRNDYLNQVKGIQYDGIVEYAKRDRQIFCKVLLSF
ncbi:MAG: hypothetical protein H7A23_01775 [Leptospiraceae bacterium]|nr:hypothetical protein [Leptospiraceae bacterium]MCP5493261.1 hypothetical protein [Leptospiraceae bacterium]